MTKTRPGMLTLLDDGMWEADARIELEELAADGRSAALVRGGRGRHAGRTDLPARRPHPGQGRMRRASLRLAAGSGRIRTRAGSSGSASTRPRPRRRPTNIFANSLAGSAIALNSSALPAGSSRNIVACSPGWPSKRTVGAMTNSTSAASRRAASARQSSIASTRPKCGTGTSSPSTGLVERAGACPGARWATI